MTELLLEDLLYAIVINISFLKFHKISQSGGEEFRNAYKLIFWKTQIYRHIPPYALINITLHQSLFSYNYAPLDTFSYLDIPFFEC